MFDLPTLYGTAKAVKTPSIRCVLSIFLPLQIGIGFPSDFAQTNESTNSPKKIKYIVCSELYLGKYLSKIERCHQIMKKKRKENKNRRK